MGDTRIPGISRRGAILLPGALATAACAGNSTFAAGADAAFGDAALGDMIRRLDEGPGLAAGGEGELAIAAHLEAELASLGYATERQEVMAPAFLQRTAEIHAGGASVPLIPQAIVRPTGPEGLTAPLQLWRDVNDSAAAAGAIALVELPYGRHTRLGAPTSKPLLDDALAAGAVAVVLVTTGPTGEAIALNADFTKPPAQVPVGIVGPRAAAPLVAAARRGEHARLIIDGDALRRPTYNLIGRISGRGPLLVVSTPRTGWFKCVAERGPGLAIFLALAKWAVTALPTNDLLFVSTGAHEYDNGGSLAFLNERAPAPGRAALWVHLGAGFAARDFHEAYGFSALPSVDSQRYLMGTDDTVPILRSSFAGQPGLEQPYPTSMGAAGELMEIVAHGHSPAFGLFAGHYYHHTETDRADKVHVPSMRAAAVSTREAIHVLLKRR